MSAYWMNWPGLSVQPEPATPGATSPWAAQTADGAPGAPPPLVSGQPELVGALGALTQPLVIAVSMPLPQASAISWYPKSLGCRPSARSPVVTALMLAQIRCAPALCCWLTHWET